MTRREALGALALLFTAACAPRGGALSVYCAQDQVYAERLFADFTRHSGIEVRALFDTEATKGAGLTNRLIAERSHPQASVFWNNEALRTHQLAKAGVVGPDILEFGYRSRRLVINTRLVLSSEAPKDWLELAEPKWRGKVALAYPLFGSTATHFVALREKLDADKWRDWCKALAANKPFLVDGNSVVTRLVGAGEALVGMTDSDDITAGIRNGLPLAALPISEHSLLIPNTVCKVAVKDRSGAAERFIEYLTRPSTVLKLVELGALEGANLLEESSGALPTNWSRLADGLPAALESLREIFLRT